MTCTSNPVILLYPQYWWVNEYEQLARDIFIILKMDGAIKSDHFIIQYFNVLLFQLLDLKMSTQVLLQKCLDIFDFSLRLAIERSHKLVATPAYHKSKSRVLLRYHLFNYYSHLLWPSLILNPSLQLLKSCERKLPRSQAYFHKR